MRNNSPSLIVPYIISITIHMVFFGWVILSPAAKKPDIPFKRDQVIDVNMVNMPASPEPALSAKETVAEKRSKPPTTPSKKDAVVIPDKPKPEVKKAVSIAPKKPKIKTALKQRTFKPKEIKKPIHKIVKKPPEPEEKPETDVFKRLREKVQADEASGRYSASLSNKDQATGQGTQGDAASRRRAELIDLYRLEIAKRVNKNWAFSEQLAGHDKNLMASLVFKVMPDGEIRDIFFIDRSGNQYLDDSAYKAVIKTNPAPPHPKGLVESFVDVGLRFTPEGIR
jgi:colicin import membrane protein